MKRKLALIASALFLSSLLSASGLVAVRTLPSAVDEFIFQRNAMANSPEGGASVFITALIIYTKDKNIGMQCLTIALDSTRLAEGSTYKGMTPDKAASEMIVSLSEKSKSFIPNSYVTGTHPDRDYSWVLPFSYEFVDTPKTFRSDLEAKVFVKSSGDQNLRAVTLKKNDKGIWKVVDFSDLMKPVSQPVHKKGDDL